MSGLIALQCRKVSYGAKNNNSSAPNVLATERATHAARKKVFFCGARKNEARTALKEPLEVPPPLFYFHLRSLAAISGSNIARFCVFSVLCGQNDQNFALIRAFRS